MFAWRRGGAFIALLLALSALAQDNPSETKPDSKTSTPKKEEKKPEPKDDKKAPATKYHLVRRVVGRVSNIDTVEKLIELEVRVPTSRTGSRSEKLTWKMVEDVKVRNVRPIDDEGKLISNLQEKQKRKGTDPKLPGYLSRMESLKNDQIVQVDLCTTKSPNATSRNNTQDDEKPVVAMIVIYEEPQLKIEKKKKQ